MCPSVSQIILNATTLPLYALPLPNVQIMDTEWDENGQIAFGNTASATERVLADAKLRWQ